jgi:hypothetical protein
MARSASRSNRSLVERSLTRIRSIDASGNTFVPFLGNNSISQFKFDE